MKTQHSVQLLEQLLGRWELQQWIKELFFANPQLSAFTSYLSEMSEEDLQETRRVTTHWRTLRQHLLDVPVTGFDFLRYMPNTYERIMEAWKVAWDMVPAWLASWIQSSKRVFALDKELQQLLTLTGNRDIRWDMVRLPLDTFFLKLGQPIWDEGSGMNVGGMLLTHESVYIGGLLQRPRTLLFINNDYPTLQDIPIAERQKIARLASTNPTECAQRLSKMEHSAYHIGSIMLPEEIEKSLDWISWESMTSKKDAGTIKCLNIFFSFLCYLNTLPRGTFVDNEMWVDVEKKEHPPRLHKAVTYGTQALYVNFGQKLTAEERLALQSTGTKSGGELSAHWRRGYFRRAPGFGDDPNAPRNIWVRPTLVRRDKMEAGEIPAGSEQEVR